MPQLINWPLMANPLNWAIVILVLGLLTYGAHYIIAISATNQLAI